MSAIAASETVADTPSATSSCGCSSDVTRPQNIAGDWGAVDVDARLAVLRRARHTLAAQSDVLVAAISPTLTRTALDTLTAEVLPLLDAIRFLERNAAKLLAPRKVGRRGRPLWLAGVTAEVQRVPLGNVLVLGPANFPLFLPGVQVMQALAAGNTVTWKPGRGGAAVAHVVADALFAAGLPQMALRVTADSVEAAETALSASPDKVFLTGSSATAASVLTTLAQTQTPAVVELSGADAVFVLPGADLALAARAIAFGLRLNGGAVCMSPRRLFANDATLEALLPLIQRELAAVPATVIGPRTATQLRSLLDEARAAGAEVLGEVCADRQRPVLVRRVRPDMPIARTDIFAPVLSLIAAGSMLEALNAYAQCPLALTASIFSGPSERASADALAARLRAGVVLHNDIIAPTADPRLPFGGRGSSGYGVTRGAEGLLEMTAVKTVIRRSGGRMRHLEPHSSKDADNVRSLIGVLHGGTLRARWTALRDLVQTNRAQR